MKDGHRAFESIYLLSELIVIILYLLFTEYGEGVHPADNSSDDGALKASDAVRTYYALFQDVHVMIFIGFGFLMVFLKTHSWTSVGYNFLIAAYALQITILVTGFWHQALKKPVDEWEKIELSIPALIIGDFGAGCVLITFGAILGKCSLVQLWFVATLEIIFYGLNETICAGNLGAVDMGGSMYVHTFGAYFGLAATYFFDYKKAIRDEKGRCDGNYNSQLIAMVGTIFLWMFWPSFNGALAGAAQQQRVIVNTVMAISASCITACGISRLWLQRLDMEVVLNATLAGGVAIGSASDLIVTGGVAMLIGSFAGIVSAVGFLKLSAFLREKISLHDTCGVHNLHGMPGIMGGIIGALSASLSDSSFENEAAIAATFPKIAEGRTTAEQGWIQLLALGITLGIAIFGGIITGFLASRCGKLEELFEDSEHFAHVKYDEVDLQQMREEVNTIPDSAIRQGSEAELQQMK